MDGAAGEWNNPAAAWKTLGPPKGRLLMTGGQPILSMARRFVGLVGDPDARIVVIPNFNGKERDAQCRELDLLKEAGAKNAQLWHTIDRRAANSKKFVKPLAEADAVWICRGEQWKLADAYRHTLAHAILFSLLERGGVIAASGGGARFLADRMAGDPYGWNRKGDPDDYIGMQWYLWPYPDGLGLRSHT